MPFCFSTPIFSRESWTSLFGMLFRESRFLSQAGYGRSCYPGSRRLFATSRQRSRSLRRSVLRLSSKTSSADSVDLKENAAFDSPKIEVLFDDENFVNHGYWYYHNLLALRKAWGPISDAVLAKPLGRKPTKDELLAEVQKPFGARAFRMARKGLEAAGSANKLTDEQLVVMAVLTAITKGREVFIFTRDADVLEQYY